MRSAVSEHPTEARGTEPIDAGDMSRVPVPRLPAFDASAFSAALKRNVLKPDGTPYAVFDTVTSFVQGLRAQRDALNAVSIYAADVKRDVDSLRASSDQRLDGVELRLAALEAQPVRPFPASG